ncbi:MAG: SLBB domain-containing protein [Sphingomonadales bacterium]|nr:SLBB domain-containing protein [Sphingomonadales bacterium]MDE2168850.1 SLBB domain-containing protein [Sphingomonadales bacterium]
MKQAETQGLSKLAKARRRRAVLWAVAVPWAMGTLAMLATLGTPAMVSAQTDPAQGSASSGTTGNAAAGMSVAPAASAAPVGPGFDQKQVPTSAARPTVDQPDMTANALMAARSPDITKPGEFETYLQQLTGRPIHRFGANLLVPGGHDYLVPATTAIPPDYAINVGDVIAVAMTGSVEGSAEFEVGRDGRIFLPHVGAVDLAGVHYRDLKARIAAAIGTQYRGFDVTVSIQRLRGVRVYVTGFAQKPGVYTVSSLSTLLNAVLAAGGPNAGGSFRSVKLYRNGQELRDFDLYDVIRHGNRTGDTVLQNEDVLFIPPVGPQVAVIGSVNEEAIYEARPGETLEQVLADAGGPSQLADDGRGILYRLSDKDTVGSRALDRAALATTPVQGGDILQIANKGSLARPMEHQSVLVRLEGEVERPGNYFVPAGTPLSKVLDMAGGLTSKAYPYGTKLTRLSVREQQRASYQEALDQMETSLVATALASGGGKDGNSAADGVHQLVQRLRQTEPDGRLVMNLPVNARSLPGDMTLENNDRIVVPALIDTVGVFGAVYRPASFSLLGEPPHTVKDYIDRAGGTQRLADKGAIFVVRANGDVISHKKGAMRLTVQPGDMIFVPVRTMPSTVWARIRDVTQAVFSAGLSAAVAVAAL